MPSIYFGPIRSFRSVPCRRQPVHGFLNHLTLLLLSNMLMETEDR